MSDAIQAIVAIPAPFNMVVLIVLIGCGAGVVTSIAQEIRKYFCHHESLELKRELADRGMSADEVERIMNSDASWRSS